MRTQVIFITLVVFFLFPFPLSLYTVPKKVIRSAEKTDQKTVQHYIHQLKKTVRCAWGVQGCSEEEIEKARFLVAKIGVGMLVLGVGTPVVIKKILSNDQGSWIELTIPPLPAQADELLKEHNYRIDDKAFDAIKRIIGNNQKVAHDVFLWLWNAVDNNKIDFASPVYDQGLWQFLKERGARLPSQRGRPSFYLWDKRGNRIGIAQPNPHEEPLRIGEDNANNQTSSVGPVHGGMED